MGGRNGNAGVWIWLASLLFGALLLSVCDGLTNNMPELSDFFAGLSPQAKVGWPQSDPCGSSWHVVSCTGADVTAIFIKNLGLTGTLRPSITQLPRLTRLDAQGNSLGGPLPTFNGTSAPLITTLFLGSNQFTSMPADFFNGLTGLQIFSLDCKSPLAAWSVPDLSNNPMLINFTSSGCGMTGPIPDSFGSLTALTTLSLSYNALTGPLPPSLASARALSVLQLNNQAPPGLSGNLSILGDLQGLTVAWLHGNNFSGPLPDNLPSGLRDLKLNNNQLVGPLPASMSSLTALQTLYIQNNYLSGPLPSFPNKNLDLTKDDADFCGATCNPQVNALLVFLAGLGYPQSLAMAWLGPNPCAPWRGIVCDTTTNPTITSINLPLQQLTGSISPALATLTGLQQIVLHNNSLTGTIPDLSGLLKLVKLDVRYNSLSPPVPSFPASVTVLTVGNPAIDALSTPAPSVPPSVAPGAPPSVSPPVSPAPGSAPGSDAPGSAPGSAPGGTSKPSPPSSTPPGKTGSAPSSGDATDAVAGSSKSASIPVAAVAGPVVGVVSLLVLAGVVFYCCYQKKRKGFLRVPSSTASVMIHPRDSSSDPEVVKIVVGGIAGAASKTHSRTSSGPSDVTVVGENNNLVISIEVLRDVTKNFSDENVLGRGGFGVVYKGQLEDGTMIAVKRMEAAVVSSKGLSEFQAEIAVLTKVRHRHLVALLGYCVEGNERLLVYEYMPQGTLSQHLFDWKSHDEKPLPWKKRLSIALDVARGMEYLHGLAHKSFIHRDLKPSNILLGDDFRAKVSDFGLVKLAPEGKYSVETRLAGTFGYLAPEYAVTGRVTTKADVFSFGVVLMELVTGRRALDETQPEENMHLVTWFRRTNTNKENFMKAIDSSIDLNEETLQTVLIVAELAGHCTAPEPYQRPDMGHAVNVLAPLVEMWKPSNYDPEDNAGINMELSLPQALKQWQALGDLSMTSSLDDTKTSLPTGFADSFTSADGR